MENTIYISNLKIENYSNESDRLNLEGYCCHWYRPNLNSERVDKNSFNMFFEMYNEGKIKPYINFNHNSEQIIGGVDELTTDERGMYLKGHLNRGIKINDEMLIPNIVAGNISGFSTEGQIIDGYNGIDEKDDGTYYVRNFLLTAIAVTPTPADWDAKFSFNSFINEYKENKLQELKDLKTNSKWFLL